MPTASLIDPRALMRIQSLQVRARIIVQGFLSGLHRSPSHGFSVEFSEYRNYSPGDDTRYIDWRLLARTDRYYVKRFEEETNLRCHLLVDLSRSMGYGSREYTKADYARTAAATLAYFLTGQRDAVGLTTFADAVADALPARYRPGHLHRLMTGLERAVAGTSTDLDSPLRQIVRTVRKRGLLVLISDLLADAATLEARLRDLRAAGHDVVILRVLDPAEIDFPFDTAATFVDAESGRDVYVDPIAAREQYRRNFAGHAARIAAACARLGVDLYTFSTAEPLEYALQNFLQSRSRQGRLIKRGGA